MRDLIEPAGTLCLREKNCWWLLVSNNKNMLSLPNEITSRIFRKSINNNSNEEKIKDLSWTELAHIYSHQKNLSKFRDLLLEFCEGSGLMVANTFIDERVDRRVTFMEAGARPLGEITEDKHNTLDLMLCDASMLQEVVSLYSMR